MSEESGFKKCCAEEIKRLWDENGGPMGIVHCETTCPKCSHYIGLTQTPVKEADKFLKEHGLSL